jgi:hypothetical protein
LQIAGRCPDENVKAHYREPHRSVRSASHRKEGGANAVTSDDKTISGNKAENLGAKDNEREDARREPSQLTRTTEVVRRRAYRVHLSRAGIVQQRPGDDCAKSGLEACFPEGAEFRDADADLLYQSRREKSERQPSASACACERALAQADRASEVEEARKTKQTLNQIVFM